MADIKKLTEIFDRLGAPNPEEWASSQVVEGIPQLHRYLFLKQAWTYVVDDSNDRWIDNVLANNRRNRERGNLRETDALERMLANGVPRADITELVRETQIEMMSSIAYLLDDPSLSEDVIEQVGDVGWALVSTDANYEPTNEAINGLHESVFETDPTGREGQPRRRKPDSYGRPESKGSWLQFWRK